jgi:branched-chain amino acid transport system substrate-binding protein
MNKRSLFAGGVLSLLLVALAGAGCKGDDTVRFAAILPLSGPVGAYGTPIKQGIELAWDQHRQAAGEQGQKVEVSFSDSQADPATAARLLDEAYSAGAVAAIGGVTSDEALAMVKVAEERDRILVSPSASSPELTGISSNFFRVFPSDFVEGTKMATFAVSTLEIREAVILAVEAPYGQGIQQVFKAEFERHGGKVVEVLEFASATTDVSGLVERVTTLSPPAVYVAAYWNDTVSIIKALQAGGYKGKVLTTAAFATPQAVSEAGSAAEGVYFTQTVFAVSSDAEPIRSFVTAYRDKYGSNPDLYAAHGYDAMRVVLDALAKGGTAPSDFWKGMRSIRDFVGVTGPIQFDEKGDVKKFPRVYVIKDGEPINYEDYVDKVKEAFRRRLQELEQQRQRLGRPAPPPG